MSGMPPSSSNPPLKPYLWVPLPQSRCQYGLADSEASWSSLLLACNPLLTLASVPAFLGQHLESMAESPSEASHPDGGVLVLPQCQAEQLPWEHRSAGRERCSAGRVHEEHQARLMGPRSRHHQPGGGNSAKAIRKLLWLIPWSTEPPHSQ